MNTDPKTQAAQNPMPQADRHAGCDGKEDKDLIKTIWMYLLYQKRYS